METHCILFDLINDYYSYKAFIKDYQRQIVNISLWGGRAAVTIKLDKNN